MGCRSCNSDVTKSASYVLSSEQQLLKDQKPTVESDGSLLFSTIAPTMSGYVHDRGNPNRLKPDTVPCTGRITLPVLGQNGYWVLNQCNQIGCPTRGTTVDEIVCDGCQFRTTKVKSKPLE